MLKTMATAGPPFATSRPSAIPNFILTQPNVERRLGDLRADVSRLQQQVTALVDAFQFNVSALFVESPDIVVPVAATKESKEALVTRLTHELLLASFKSPKGTVILNPMLRNMGGESAFKVAEDCNVYRRYLAANGIQDPVTSFHLGDKKGLDTPNSFLRAFEAALQDPAKTTYTPAPGLPGVRSALANYLNDVFGLNLTGTNVAMSAAKSVINKLMNLVVRPGVRVAYPVPGYPMYSSGTTTFGGTPTPYRFDAEGQLSIESIKEALQSGAKVLVLNDDHNPTGNTMTEATAKQLQNLLNQPQCKDVVVIFDVAYARIRLDDSPSNLSPLMQDMFDQKRGIGVWTFSKEGAATGLRIGAVFMPEIPAASDGTAKTVMDGFIQLIGNQESCPVAPVQYALEELLTKHRQDFDLCVKQNCNTLRERRDEVAKGLSAINDTFGRDVIKFTRPSAGFYQYADVTELMQELGFGKDVEAFRREALREARVSVCSNLHFGETEKHLQSIRFAFSGVEKAEIESAMIRFSTWIQSRRDALAYFKDKDVTIVGSGDVARTAVTWLAGVARSTTIVSKYGAEQLKADGITMAAPVVKTVAPSEFSVVPSARDITTPQDIILVATKRGSDGQISADIELLLGPNPHVVFLQNGIDAGKVFTQILHGKEVVVSQVSIFAQLTHNEQGQVLDRKQAKWVMGPTSAAEPEANTTSRKELAKHLRALGMQNSTTETYDQFRETLAKKLLNNLANYACMALALSGNGLCYGDLLADNQSAKHARATLKIAVHELLTLFQDQKLPFAQEVNNTLVETVYKTILNYAKTQHVSTTVNALQGGLEIEDLVSEVREKSPQVATPTLDGYIQMVKDHNADKKPHPDLKSILDPATYDSRLALLTAGTEA